MARPTAPEAIGSLEQGDLALAYSTLCKHVEALEQEWRESGLVRELEEFETEYLEEQTARELGVAGALTLGLTVLHQTVKALLPAQVATPVVGGCWVLGGALIVFRLTAGTVAGWVGVMERNSRRKRQLRAKLEALEARIRAMLATQEVLMGEQRRQGAPPPPVAGAEAGGGGNSSPPGSTGSAELVEAPGDEERGAAPAPSTGGPAAKPAEGGIESWRRYASLGGKSKKP